MTDDRRKAVETMTVLFQRMSGNDRRELSNHIYQSSPDLTEEQFTNVQAVFERFLKDVRYACGIHDYDKQLIEDGGVNLTHPSNAYFPVLFNLLRLMYSLHTDDFMKTMVSQMCDTAASTADADAEADAEAGVRGGPVH